MDFFEVVHTQRSIRSFRPDPVPEEAIWTIIAAAVRAPSGSNLQPWIWLVVRDQAKRPRDRGPRATAAVAERRRLLRERRGRARADHPVPGRGHVARLRSAEPPGGVGDLRRGAEHDAGGARGGSRHGPDDVQLVHGRDAPRAVAHPRERGPHLRRAPGLPGPPALRTHDPQACGGGHLLGRLGRRFAIAPSHATLVSNRSRAPLDVPCAARHFHVYSVVSQAPRPEFVAAAGARRSWASKRCAPGRQ